MLVVPVLWKPLRESRYLFRHQLGVAVVLYGMYAASLTPGVYTGFGYTTSRYLNAIYINFLIMIFGSVLYIEGSLIRWMEKYGSLGGSNGFVCHGRRFCAFYLAVSLALFTLGGFASTIMNRPSINATKVLVTGEAAQFHREMLDRQAYILARKIQGCLQLNFIYEKTQDLYAQAGRPSVDPVLLVKMLLIGYLYGIKSERRLEEEVNLNLAYRWFCNLNVSALKGAIPTGMIYFPLLQTPTLTTRQQHASPGRATGTQEYRNILERPVAISA